MILGFFGSAVACSSVMDLPVIETPATGFGKVVQVVGFFFQHWSENKTSPSVKAPGGLQLQGAVILFSLYSPAHCKHPQKNSKF